MGCLSQLGNMRLGSGYLESDRNNKGAIMQNEVTPDAITAVLDALVGSTAAQADSVWDAESQENVPKFEAVCDWVYKRLCDAQRHYNSPYYSAKQTAHMVMNAAGDLAYLFMEELEQDEEQ